MKTVEAKIDAIFKKLEMIEKRSNDGLVKLWARESAKELKTILGL